MLPAAIGVLVGCFARKIDGDSWPWFTWWLKFIYQGYPSTSPKRTPMTVDSALALTSAHAGTTVDGCEIHFAPPKKPCNDDSPINTQLFKADLLTCWFSHFGFPYLVTPKGDHLLVPGPNWATEKRTSVLKSMDHPY